MGGKAALDKGKRAERAVVQKLKEVLDRVSAELGVDNTVNVCRNLMQSLEGGHDVCVPWCAIEVKHHERLEVVKWWCQCLASAQRMKLEPVLIYKQNNVSFRVRLFTHMHVWDGTQVKVLSDIAFDDYLFYFEQQARAYFVWLGAASVARAAVGG
jgi:hypothetical protein